MPTKEALLQEAIKRGLIPAKGAVQDSPIATQSQRAVSAYTREDILAEIERRGLQQPQDPKSQIFREMAAEVGPMQAFLTGTGKGFTDVARGLSIMEPAGESEKLAMEELHRQRPYTTGAGELLGQTAPFIPIGGVPAAAGRLGAVARIGSAAATGATEAGVVARGRGEDIIQGAGIGGAFSAGAEILFPIIGKIGRRLYQNAFGRAPAGAMIDSMGRPTAEFQRALDASGMSFDDLSEQAMEAVRQASPGSNPEQVARMARFETEGIPATLGDITRGTAQQTTEQRLMGSTLDPAAEPFRQFRLQQSDAIKDNLTSAVGEEFVKEDAGQLMQAALEGRQSTLRTQKNELYRLAQSRADDLGGMPLFTEGIAGAIPDARTMRRLSRTQGSQIGALEELLVEFGVSADDMAVDRFLKSGGEIEPLSLSNVEEFRSELNRLIRSDPTGATSIAVGPVRDALDREIVEMADSVGDVAMRLKKPDSNKVIPIRGAQQQRVEDIRELTDTLKAARETVSQMKKEFDPASLVGKLISTRGKQRETPMVAASKVYDTLMSKAQPVEQVRKVVKSLGDAGNAGERGLAALQSTTMLDLIEAGFSTPSRTIDGVPIFNPVAFKRRLKNMGQDKVKAVFKNRPDVVKKIKNIDKISSDLIPTDRAVPKGTSDNLLDVLNVLGVLTIAGAGAKGPVAGMAARAAEKVTGSAVRKVGRMAERSQTRRQVNEALEATPEIMESIGRNFPAIREILQAATPPVALETQRQRETR